MAVQRQTGPHQVFAIPVTPRVFPRLVQWLTGRLGWIQKRRAALCAAVVRFRKYALWE